MYSGIGWYTNLETGCMTIGAKLMSYKIPASHTVCRYEFMGEDFDVVSKFHAEPIGDNKNYNAE